MQHHNFKPLKGFDSRKSNLNKTNTVFISKFKNKHLTFYTCFTILPIFGSTFLTYLILVPQEQFKQRSLLFTHPGTKRSLLVTTFFLTVPQEQFKQRFLLFTPLRPKDASLSHPFHHCTTQAVQTKILLSHTPHAKELSFNCIVFFFHTPFFVPQRCMVMSTWRHLISLIFFKGI